MTISDREQYHCFLDCIAYSLRSGAAIEHRPLYFGNWDSPFVLEKDGTFLPNAEQHALQGYLKAYESLYCDNLWCWYDYELDKESNYLRMKELLKSKANSLHLCVQLDLFYLPYEKRNYQRHHMPHFVLIEEWGEEDCFIVDPYFDWQGYIPIEMVKDSFMENTSDGGFLIDIERSLEPNSDVISSWFMESMGLSVNELARKMMLFLEELHQNESIPLTTLTPIAAKLGIVIKRKNSYKVAFSFFMDRLLRFGDEPFERVNDLVNQWHGVAYKMIRVAIHNKRDQIYPLMDKIMEIEKQESAIKQEIYSWYLNWEEACRKSVVGGGWVP